MPITSLFAPLDQPQWRRSLRRDDKYESDDRSPLVSHSNPGGAAFAFSFAKLRKRDFRYTRKWDDSARTNRGLA